MKKYKNVIIFVAITLLWSVFLGMVKFFLRSQLKEQNISLEDIAGFISLGAVVAYLVGGTLAYVFSKKTIAIVSGIITSICLVIGHFYGYHPFWMFALMVSLIGLFNGLWLIVKSIILSTEIYDVKISETLMNGIVNIVTLIGLLGGSYFGFVAFTKRGNNGFISLVGLLLFTAILTIFLNYDSAFQKKSSMARINIAIPNIFAISKKYIWLLIPISTLWAISTVIGQKLLAIGIDTFNKVPKNSIVIIIFSFIGAIVGHAISASFTSGKRKTATFFMLIFGAGAIYFPHFINEFTSYFALNACSFALGLFFGIAINILEARYFYHIGEDKEKEFGSAAYGLMTSIMMFSVMLMSDFLTQTMNMKFSFFLCGTLLLLTTLFIPKLDLSSEKGNS